MRKVTKAYFIYKNTIKFRTTIRHFGQKEKRKAELLGST